MISRKEERVFGIGNMAFAALFVWLAVVLSPAYLIGTLFFGCWGAYSIWKSNAGRQRERQTIDELDARISALRQSDAERDTQNSGTEKGESGK